ncbi:hypothetical protein [Paenibacillus sp. EZ-K15]|nr:hypothetical protein [Paenibacillus sp. EZ-K15]
MQRRREGPELTWERSKGTLRNEMPIRHGLIAEFDLVTGWPP